MGDPLSVISGVVGIATAGVQLANVIYNMSARFSGAHREMFSIADNLSLLSGILEELAEVLNQGQSVIKPQVLAKAEAINLRFHDVQEKVEKLIKACRGRRGRLMWYLNFEKAQELLGELEALKSGLNLVLWTVQLAVNGTGPRKDEKKSDSFSGYTFGIADGTQKRPLSQLG